jgi:hypothetical protein
VITFPSVFLSLLILFSFSMIFRAVSKERRRFVVPRIASTNIDLAVLTSVIVLSSGI